MDIMLINIWNLFLAQDEMRQKEKPIFIGQ